jgi:hypothetical protein
MSRRWRIASLIAIVILYLVPAVLAQYWWMGAGNQLSGFGNVSLWGKAVASLQIKTLSIEPILIALFSSIPAAIVCYVARTRWVRAWMSIFPLYHVYIAARFLIAGGYFGCDRNGCSAEENFIITFILTPIVSLLGLGVLLFLVHVPRNLIAAWRHTRVGESH